MDWEEIFANWITTIPGGGVILGIIAAAIVLSPMYKKIATAIEEWRKKRAEKEKEKLDELLAEKDFRTNVNAILEKLPDMDDRLEQMSSNVNSLSTVNESLMKTIKELEDSSSKEDKDLRAKLGETQELVTSMHTDVKHLTEKVDVMIDGDRDEFRAYLLQLYTECVIKSHRLKTDEVEILHIRFRKYKRENGNGWAEKMYGEILKTPTVDGKSVSSIIEGLEERDSL